MKTLPLGPLILDLEGMDVTAQEKELLCHPLVGGVIFFKRNYENPEQLIDLVSQLRAIRTPLLLCVDQEGGRVQRFREGFTSLPPLRALAQKGEQSGADLSTLLNWSEKLGKLMALEVRACGVDLSFAPVLDLDRGLSEVIGDRAFSPDPDTVVALAAAYIKGMQQAGMQATGKHFPGHGAVKVDSHLDLPIDNRAEAEIAVDRLPFEKLIRQGLPALMPAHIVFSQLDPQPVGFSSYWLQTVLRARLGFKGTIFSDDLSMEGAKAIGDAPTRAQAALEAGCDFILICNQRASVIEVLDKVKEKENEIIQKRRQAMLGKSPFPFSWKTLRETSAWQEAYEVVEWLEKAADAVRL